MKIKEEIEIINKKLTTYDLGTEPHNLYDPIHYFLTLGGKRFRPLLAFIGASLYTDNYREFILPALSTEVFHNFTLVHDDIMDNAPLRRGKTTVHEKWNSNIAILSGDVMFVKAYELLAHTPKEHLPLALRLFNTCAKEVCEGQQYDMDFETRDDVTIPEYLEMIRLKTAVLLGYSLALGAILGGSTEKDYKALQKFGEYIGIGFQLQDDLLDTFGKTAAVGKTIGGDILQNKKTFLLLKTLELASDAQRKEIQHWLSISDQPEQKIAAIKGIMSDLGMEEKTKELMNDYFQKGFEYLNDLSANPDRLDFLKSFSYNLIEREK